MIIIKNYKIRNDGTKMSFKAIIKKNNKKKCGKKRKNDIKSIRCIIVGDFNLFL